MGPRQEWLTLRPLRLVLLQRTMPAPADTLSDAEVTTYRRLAETTTPPANRKIGVAEKDTRC